MAKPTSEPGAPADPESPPIVESDATEVKSHPSSPPSSGARSRFTPGMVLDDRYRIVAPLGRGGMGEVYRAEDIKLGQQVALKFLPSHLAKKPEIVRRLYGEVRLGRQVSHPNVCRLYDVGEWQGHPFIAMEYIDGEDLASLLRRIGKLPHDKAIDLARDICAGLAAAHGLGVIHRDLKPANIMIDGRGNARITDFGLAALVDDLKEKTEIAGTPAYMAPEQLRGEEVTQRTDLYALGLILYEMFTGKRLFDGASVPEISSQHETTTSQSLSRQTGEIDPAIQRVILRCLEKDPAARPASIHSVIAALPGGDPLQAAIDAGETPSPEMVAAAGESGELAPTTAWPLLIATILLIVLAAHLWSSTSLLAWIPMPEPPQKLAFRAAEIAESLELAAPAVDRDFWFYALSRHFAWAQKNRPDEGWSALSKVHTPPIKFRYRQSPRELIPRDLTDPIAANDPDLGLPGMVDVVLDPEGNLLYVAVVPPDWIDDPPRDDEPVDWRPWIEAAGFDPDTIEEVEPQWTPEVPSTARVAWTGNFPGQEDVVLRIEAASFHGNPVWFEVIPPWQKPTPPAAPVRSTFDWVRQWIGAISFVSALLLAATLARRNYRRGRGDPKGAWRIAIFAYVTSLSTQLLTSDTLGSSRALDTIISHLLDALSFPVAMWVFYMALEPYLRRRWPRVLIGWARLVNGRQSDPRVGRDLLIGVCGGAIFACMGPLMQMMSNSFPPLMWPLRADLQAASGLRLTGAFFMRNVVLATWFPMFIILVLLLGHLILRHRVAAIVFAWIIMIFMYDAPGGNAFLALVAGAVASALLLGVTFRWGLVATASMTFTAGLLGEAPLMLDPSSWLFGRSIAILVLIGLVAIGGFYLSLGSRPMFSQAVLEE